MFGIPFSSIESRYSLVVINKIQQLSYNNIKYNIIIVNGTIEIKKTIEHCEINEKFRDERGSADLLAKDIQRGRGSLYSQRESHILMFRW